MKSIILTLAIIAAAVANAASPAATQDWVRNYLATNGTTNPLATSAYTNGVLSATATAEGGTVTIDIEDCSVYALIATNATTASAAYGITNGFAFVWRGTDGTNGIYRSSGETIYASRTNWVWRGSATTNGVFGSSFEAFGAKVQPSFAAQFTEE